MEVETWVGDVFAEANGLFHRFEGPKNGAKYYKKIEKVLSSARTLKMGHGGVFQHDNSLKLRGGAQEERY